MIPFNSLFHVRASVPVFPPRRNHWLFRLWYIFLTWVFLTLLLCDWIWKRLFCVRILWQDLVCELHVLVLLTSSLIVHRSNVLVSMYPMRMNPTDKTDSLLGRGPGTHAYTHSLMTDNHVFLNLSTLKVCLRTATCMVGCCAYYFTHLSRCKHTSNAASYHLHTHTNRHCVHA